MHVMAKISILGLADTRVLVLCIAKAFMIDGKTVIITDDTSYKRLMVRDYDYTADKDVTFGRLEDVDIVVDTRLKDKVNGRSIDSYAFSTTEGMGETYKNFIFVSDEVFDKTNGFTIICKSDERTFDSAMKSCKAVVEALEEKKLNREDEEKPDALKTGAIKVVEVDIKSQVKGKGVDNGNVIRLGGPHLAWVLEVEETKKLDGIKDTALINKIDEIVGEGCGMGNGRLAQFMSRSYMAE